ncbi:MAG: PhnD/SsuA/transferrin family substrate-binding protein [Pseudomonadota bacterium]
MIASLPMYASPHTRAAEQRFWTCLRNALRGAGLPAPDRLTDDIPDLMTHWRSPDLILSQTCSLPYRTKLREHVTLVGTPDYGIKGCPPGHYRSVVVTQANNQRHSLEDFKSARVAINDPISQSGWAALVFEAPWVLETSIRVTGSHRASLLAVLQDHADFAAIDAVTFRMLSKEGLTDRVRILHHTRPSPGLPFIAARSAASQTLFACLEHALSELRKADRAALGIRSILRLPQDAYDLPIPPAPRTIAG